MLECWWNNESGTGQGKKGGMEGERSRQRLHAESELKNGERKRGKERGGKKGGKEDENGRKSFCWYTEEKCATVG